MIFIFSCESSETSKLWNALYTYTKITTRFDAWLRSHWKWAKASPCDAMLLLLSWVERVYSVHHLLPPAPFSLFLDKAFQKAMHIECHSNMMNSWWHHPRRCCLNSQIPCLCFWVSSPIWAKGTAKPFTRQWGTPAISLFLDKAFQGEGCKMPCTCLLKCHSNISNTWWLHSLICLESPSMFKSGLHGSVTPFGALTSLSEV